MNDTYEIEIEFGDYIISLLNCTNTMDYRQLRAFLTIAETGNMTRASEILHLVQPAISRQLRMLEDDIGVKLFERERYGMALTEAGKSLLGYARRAMLELDRARAELSGSSAEIAGIVTVGLLPSTCDLLASQLVTAVAREYPRILIRIVMGYAGAMEQWLESGEIDTAILYGFEHEPRIQAKALLSEPLWLIGSAAARLDKHQPVKLESLAGKAMILPNGPGGIRTIIDRICALSNLTLHVSAETNSMSVQKSLVLGGHGFTIGTPIAFAQELGSGQLSGAPLGEGGFTRTIGLALAANRPVPQPVRHVVELLERCMKESVQQDRWTEAVWIGD